jgi:hypothetical protein
MSETQQPINKEPINNTITNNEKPTQEITHVEATQQQQQPQPVKNADDGSWTSYMKRSIDPREFWPFRSDAPLETVVAPANQAAQPAKSIFGELSDRFNNAVFRGGKKTKGKGKKSKKKSKRRSTKKSKKAAKALNKA